jgi:hypothetical protein
MNLSMRDSGLGALGTFLRKGWSSLVTNKARSVSWS